MALIAPTQTICTLPGRTRQLARPVWRGSTVRPRATAADSVEPQKPSSPGKGGSKKKQPAAASTPTAAPASTTPTPAVEAKGTNGSTAAPSNTPEDPTPVVVVAQETPQEPPITPPPSTPPPPPPAYETPDIGESKMQLLDSLFGIERGLSASAELRGEINELVTQLEAANPTPSPNDALEKLKGEWRLVYTSNSELIGLLALSRLPLVTVGEITQTVDPATASVSNKVQLSVPFAQTAVSTRAAFEVRSPKLLNVRFEQGTVATPQLLEGVELPNTVSVMGQTVDLTPLQAVLRPGQGAVEQVISNVSKILKQQPDLTFPIAQGPANNTWLLTTYLDEDTRITRGDLGSIFILVKNP